MPTSYSEVHQIKEIMDSFLCASHGKAITTRLYEEVGAKTSNNSLKVSLAMLKELYEDIQDEDTQ